MEEEQSEPKKKLMRWVNVNLRHWRIIIRNLPFQVSFYLFHSVHRIISGMHKLFSYICIGIVATL